MEYYNRLKELRTDKDLFQKDIAKILGIDQQYYSKYEQGKNELPIRHLRTLCLFYGVSADYILDLPNDLKYPER
ncbi:MAG: helix-turn-helix domain-containing protein [Acetobacter sp.]|nr:helix-turn-helix domain-containing protein [Bacteroides sp.]MCM1340316.1 helix-turn-helix domain-containing protein [Acetobacter sp.]MCM1433037.1 helix-turn-helix domain-containing protein [Clostridiales bacterium]